MQVSGDFLLALLGDRIHQLLLRIFLRKRGGPFQDLDLTVDLLLKIRFHFADICQFCVRKSALFIELLFLSGQIFLTY